MIESNLPIQKIAKQIKDSVQKNDVTLVYAPPGAGKSTWLPYYLLKELYFKGKIILIEPRRLAAKSVAARLAEHANENLSETIGYKVRFESKVSAQTKLEVVTEGVFLNQLLAENDLSNVDLVIFDEFHERNLQSDLSLALLLEIKQVLRPDIKIMIMSATLDIAELKTNFPDAQLLESSGKNFPITIEYEKEEETQINTRFIARRIKEIISRFPGDILTFLPGIAEIKQVSELLNDIANELNICALYADMSLEEQQRVLKPGAKRKLILATSIAETSLTIEGIKIVIDSGWMRVPIFNPSNGLTKLETVRVTQDAAIQRAGRAGRLSEGYCFRLYTETTYNRLNPKRKPEIMSADLSPVLLQLAQWGDLNFKNYRFISHPPASNINNGIQLLRQLKLIEENRLTPIGKSLIHYPTHPRLARMLQHAVNKQDRNFLHQAILLLVLIEEKDPLKNSTTIDIWERLNQFKNYLLKQKVIGEIAIYSRMQKAYLWWLNFFKIQKEITNITLNDDQLGALLARAYPDRIAGKIEKGIYKLSNGTRVSIPDTDPITQYPWLVIPNLDLREGMGKAFLACSVDIKDCMEFYNVQENIEWNEKTQRPEKISKVLIGQLLIEQKNETITKPQELTNALINQIKKEGLRLLNFKPEINELRARINWLVTNNQFNWKNLSDDDLLMNLEDWLTPYLTEIKNLKELQSLNFKQILLSWLGYEEQMVLNTLAPEFIEVPGGSKIKINYWLRPDQPILEVRLQEIFGWLETPTINNGKTKLLIQLLSPGYKPVQLTNDLKSFWNSTYFEIKKELKKRYPKHSWPDNPLTAQATRVTVKRK